MFRGLVTAKGRVAKDEQVFSTAGSTSFTVPDNVNFISAVCVGGGGGSCSADGSVSRGAGYGGDLVYGTFPVTPGETLTIVVGAGGVGPTYGTGVQYGGHGGSSGVKRGSNFILKAKGGKGGGNSTTQDTNTIDAGCLHSAQNSGGAGGTSGTGGLGGGGAAGYSGSGGSGGSSSPGASDGSGGGGGGGAYNSTSSWYGGYGGGTYLYGEGTSGAAGVNAQGERAGGNGSDDADGIPELNSIIAAGAGAGSPFRVSAQAPALNGLTGSRGGVRLVWPGQTSYFPSTDVGEP